VALNDEAKVAVEIITTINRLSDFLFVMARWIDFSNGAPDRIWTPKY
jgi:cob(I)alamin adenosyltransferase